MARKPNYDFERRERERLKAEKKAQRAADKKAARDAKRDDGNTPAGSTAVPGDTPHND